MKIKKLDIIGFKSFLERASIQFPSGISAIVGPNGCGKSNVIDALRWVMGEQSVKQLRGKSMEDIIFAGANGKPPLNMAEVTITMINDNGNAPEEFRDYSEISVTRRLYRSGESAYLMNRQPCRLKDLFNLFMGSGVGARTFAVIQQGNIGAIVDSGPEERRLFIEEAAGVTRYKFRKNEALRKVKSTEQNLLRINDIIAEVNRQMAGLRRQAKKAERYKNYKDRARAIDTRLLLHHFDDLNSRIGQTEEMLRELKDTDIGHATQIKKIDAAVEDIKLKRWQKNQEISSQKSNKFEIQRKIDRTEAELEHLKKEVDRLSSESTELEYAHQNLQEKTANMGAEVTEVASRNDNLRQEMERIKVHVEEERSGTQDLRDQLDRLNQQLETRKNDLMRLVADEARYKNIYQNASSNKENIKRRLRHIDEEVVTAAQKVTAVENQKDKVTRALEEIKAEVAEAEEYIRILKNALTAKTAELGERVKQTQTLDLERNKTRSQVTALRKMAANFDGFRDGVKAVMQARRDETTDSASSTPDETMPCPLEGIVGLLADKIEPEPGYETAVEAVLGDALQYILVEDQQAGARAIDFLQTSGSGRSGFIPVDRIKPLAGYELNALSDQRRLLDHISVPDGFESIANALLGHVAVVSTTDEALALYNQNGRVQAVVTLQGDVVSHQGVLIGGSQDKLAGILAKKQELKTLEKQSVELDRKFSESQELQKTLENEVRDLEIQLQEKTMDKRNAEDDAMEAEKELYRHSEDLKNARRSLEIVELEQEQLIGEESDLDAEMDGYNQALAKISADVQEAQAQTSEASEQISRVTSELETHNQKVVDLKLELTAIHAKLETGTQTLQRLKAFEEDSHQRLEQLQKEIVQKKDKCTGSKSRSVEIENTLQRMYEEVAELDADLAVNEDEYETIDRILRENDEKISQIQSEREKILENIRVVELDLSEKRMKKENVIAKVQDRYNCSIIALRQQLSQESPPLQMSIDEQEKELQRLKTKINNIGDVNLGAIKEYEELKERFDFLCEHRDDLVKAIEDLHKVIRKINRITQERFMATYQQVNEKLQEVFPKLFEGGSARLDLSEPDKPLETGVEYMVHPPGKKLTRMSLLSGGEKALSAIAFIFSIFLIRPASFCLLDEIDAPLDEANVIRFNNLLQLIGNNSQIIMITHNKRTMEFADTLFGVTMEHKGISKVVSVNLQNKAA
jgi:chromosome segregation protein